ncbi:PREDICTED: gibberellin-regulated protein 11-like isoform X2 [Erythranthe guttata]|uniref:gibberellin-regulated protein 11-like isoform X2 n=1 Tax=Erythranthe guttata TaxID=4155 RepID=UPI00064D9333|nr:PREDICTED: gibberellin-regulated protein 11-like isoform X2 [Erythranthe guttata]|eukprot:XP_012853508.1 PREDICTED: gibberellin-regulated protein 11-like isoform X2 [Erythranthe guttata]
MKLISILFIAILFIQAFVAVEVSSVLSDADNSLSQEDAGDNYGDCSYACSRRCSKSSRKNLCHRACKSCCARCHCVPPGTYGNKDLCPCYAKLTTHGNRPKCP